MQRFRKLTLWLYQRIALILVMLLCIGTGVALSGTFELSADLVDAQALQHARVSVHTVKEAWFLYSKAVVGRLENLDTVTASPEYHQVSGGIPVPATYTIELGEQVSKAGDGLSFRLFSDYPFPNRQTSGGPKDLFEQEALDYLKLNPTSFFYQKENNKDRLLFRYAEAIQMEPSCVNCHNTWPGSPKTDWQVGDVRGIIEITQPIDAFVAQAQDGLRSIWMTLIVIGCLALTSLILVISYLQNANQILHTKVAEKTSALNRLAHLDSLTELANRRCFDQVLEQEWRRMERQQNPLALIMCDVDYFKRYNDAYGHQAGDDCLQRIAHAINTNVRRTGDLATRYGGEEFAVIMPNTNHFQAGKVAEHIQRAMLALQIEHHHSDISDQVTLSIGIASTVPQPTSHPTDLVKAADTALYEAKLKGRNQIMMKLPDPTGSQPT
ncbi:diguanylate cyclase [Acaryochloris sp. IP29b_bin.148]|uniref:diguanylate cyclase domain-containing protein n=1 Tax=Acaryochloris sp. IP29b_bin.148 TaxID=2969218 RepID=UPI002622C7CB|nr:diguanylate cyclase [Acaryochloris sp. IP29b_bin.148]